MWPADGPQKIRDCREHGMCQYIPVAENSNFVEGCFNLGTDGAPGGARAGVPERDARLQNR
jgi:hypothetical protein